MKLDIKDLASLLNGATILLNDCSVRVIIGGAQNGEEEPRDSDYGATAIGFVHTPPDAAFDEESEL